MNKFNTIVARIMAFVMVTPTLMSIFIMLSYIEVKAYDSYPYYKYNQNQYEGWSSSTYDRDIRFQYEYTFGVADICASNNNAEVFNWNFGSSSTDRCSYEHISGYKGVYSSSFYNKNDLIAQALKIASDDRNNNCARNMYLNFLNNVYDSEGKLIKRDAGTFFNNEEPWGSDSNELVYTKVFVLDKQNGCVYYGCDYDKEHSCFLYYILFYGSDGNRGDADSFHTLVFASQAFYDIQIDAKGDYEHDGGNMLEALYNIMFALESDGDNNIFLRTAEGSNKYKARLSFINDMIRVIDHNDSGFTAYLRVPYSFTITINKDPHNGFEALKPTYKSCNSGNYNDTKLQQENCIVKYPSSGVASFTFDKNIDWEFGDTGALTMPKTLFNTNTEGSIDDSVNSMLSKLGANYLCDSLVMDGNGSNTAAVIRDGIDRLKDENTGDNTFVYQLFAAYIADIAKVAEDSIITRQTIDGWFVSGRTSNFDIVQAVLQKHIECICSNEKFEINSPVRIEGDRRVAITWNGNNLTGSKKCDDTLEDLWKSLTAYQQYVLEREYTLKLDDINYHGTRFNFFKQFKDIGAPDRINWLYSDSDIIMNIQSELEKYDESDFRNTGYAIAIARVCGLISKYAVMRGLYSDVNAGADPEDMYNLYNDKLESFLNTTFTYDTGEDNLTPIDGWLSYMPSRIGIFGDNGIEPYLINGSDGKAWKDLVILLYNVEYAFEVMGNSTFGKDRDMTLESLEAFMNSAEGRAVYDWLNEVDSLSAYQTATRTPNFNNDAQSINMLRSVIELHDMCEFMDIGNNDWSPVIKAYLDFYDKYESFFDLLRNDPQIYTRLGQGTNSVSEPLGAFFTLTGKKMSDQWSKGFANSALFVPMETNVYDANTVTFIGDTEWVSSFFYRYGFYRKALYINTDNSAIVNEFVSGEKSGTRVATLSDLLNYDRDIILTVDDNFYNAGQISDVINKIDYTPARNTEGSDDTATGWDAVKNWAGDLIDIDAANVLKTGEVTQYSKTIATSVWPLTASAEDKKDITKWKPLDAYVMSTDEIFGTQPDEKGRSREAALDAYDYSVKVPYAIVSAIYRSSDLYNECLRCSVADVAIFKSSKAICSTPGASESDWQALYNYYMLANLEKQMKNDSTSTLDVNGPIFCDIFGNIVTESGIVIIPAACNATLCGDNWTPYTVGWSEYYNNGNHIQVEEYNTDVLEWLLGRTLGVDGDPDAPINIREANKQTDKSNAGGYFWTSNGEMVLRTTELTSGSLTGTVQFDVLNKNSSVVKQLFWNDAYYNKASKMYGHTLTNLVIETMRGAPIEFIDYEYEGLDGNLNISKYGVYMAYKLEELVNSLVSGTNGNALGGNAVVTMPNLAFVNGIEYIMLYLFKIVFAVMVVGLGLSLYFDAVKNSLGIRSVVRFLITCMTTIVAITLVPSLISWTYYGANKTLLSDEAGSIMTLNYVKEYDGAEIGITSVTTPETNTKLYLKVNDVEVPWWKIIPEVLFGHTFSTVSDLYEDALKEDAMAMNPMVEMKSDGLYVDVQSIFDSTAVQFTPSTNMISSFSRKNQVSVRYITVEEETIDADGNRKVSEVQKPITYGKDTTSVVSFTCPYYVILDQLVASINEYNVSRDISAYSWSVGSNGNILTYDIISPYLTSNEFLEEGYDILGLEHVLGVPVAKELYNFPYDDDDISQMSASRWYVSDMPMNLVQSKIDNVNEYARNYVIKNKDTLGKVPDEVFLKVMAMQIAIEYNKEFNVSQGNAIEIINVDTRDLMRFMVAPKSSIYKNYSYSFSRYVYETAGTLGVVLSAILIVVYWVTSFMKPLAMLLILGLLIVNVVFRKVLFRRESKCVEGYLIGCACLCICNYIYALMLKLSMSVAEIGLGSATALVCAIIVQIVYVMSLVFIVGVEIKDWQNSGFNEFANIGGHIMNNLMSAQTFVVDKILAKTNEAYSNTSNSRKYVSEYYNMDSVSAMIDRDREREERGNYNPN